MASLGRSKLHDDLQTAFVRHREGRYDALLDSKKLKVIYYERITEVSLHRELATNDLFAPT